MSALSLETPAYSEMRRREQDGIPSEKPKVTFSAFTYLSGVFTLAGIAGPFLFPLTPCRPCQRRSDDW